MKKYIIIVASVIIILIVAIIVYNKVSIHAGENNDTLTVIGGSDGPTAVFIAGKVGGGNEMPEYKSITMEEAKVIFAEPGDYIILDVRRADEYAEGHIPGAINVANEDISDVMPSELPDLDKVIYVHCRSGRRSKEAAGKLVAIGYTNIIECGGILDWTGEIEK